MPTESKRAKTVRLAQILTFLEADYPNAEIALEYASPFELLIATMLSAQCTDERVNLVTKKLFKKYRSPEEYYAVAVEELEQDVFSTGFYKAKARNIQSCCKRLVESFGGDVPTTLDDLTSLAGVGRKTANVVLSHCFGTPGMVVDTHVTRLVNRMGIAKGTDAVALEFALMKLLPSEQWRGFTHLMINHGRAVCSARTKPFCDRCSVANLCPFPTQRQEISPKGTSKNRSRNTSKNTSKSGPKKHEQP
jgi:endonuclease III